MTLEDSREDFARFARFAYWIRLTLWSLLMLDSAVKMEVPSSFFIH
jgi:hypothetical protein